MSDTHREEPRSQPIPTFIENLPASLAPLVVRDNWVLWKWEDVKGNRTKVPYQPNGSKARSTDSTTWSSYSRVIAKVERFDGIGFCLDEDICAFDLDDCIDPETGGIHPWVQSLIERCGSYTERTISGGGIRIIGYGAKDKIHRKMRVEGAMTCELYRKPQGRYIVMTGAQIGDYPILNIDLVMDEVLAELGRINDGNGHDTSGEDGFYVDELLRTIADGGEERHGSTRSENVWWMVMEMFREGFSTEKIKKALTDPENAISAHVLEQSNPSRALSRTMSRARKDLKFSEDRNGKRNPNESNICIALAKLNVTMQLDKFSQVMTMQNGNEKPRPIQDNDVVMLRAKMARVFHLRVPKDVLYDALLESAVKNEFHPVVDHLESLRWDDRPRLDTWLVDYCGVADSPYVRAIGKIVMVAAVRRIFQPGCKYDEMLILESPLQGTEKSTLLEVLAGGDEWFTDNLPLNLSTKEVLENSSGKWIVEVSEMSGLRRAEVEHVKTFISRKVDRARMAYGRTVSQVPRQFVLIGTTNSEVYLRDPTGNRRFWPVRCGVIDLEKFRRDRDQLMAEAVALEATGFSIRLSQDLWKAAEKEQEDRVIPEPIHELLRQKIEPFSAVPEGYGGVRISLFNLMKLLDNSVLNSELYHRVADGMRRMNWERCSRKFRGSRENQSGYTFGMPPLREIVIDGKGMEAEVRYIEDEPSM